MKKVLSLVLAVLMVLSLSAVAFAKTVDKYETEAATNDGVTNKTDEKLDLGIGDEGFDPAKKNPDKPGATYYYTLLDENKEMFFVGDEDADEYIEHLSISIKESGDEMIEDYAIVKHNDVYKLKVTTKAYYTVAKKSATWNITGKRNGRLTVLTATVKPVQAWAALGDKHYDESVDKDGEVYVEVVDDCFVTCAECEAGDNCPKAHPGDSYNNEYTDDHNLGVVVTLDASEKYFEIFVGTKKDAVVWFSGKNTHKVTGVMMYDTSVAKELWTNNDAEEIAAWDFTGDLAFDYAATQHVSVGKDMFVYAVKDGKYDLGEFEWNEKTQCWETKTMAPIDVVVSDVELKVATAEGGKENPGTGSVDFVNVAVALGVVSLAAAGAVALKK